MTHSLRRIALVMFALFAALLVNLNYLQVLRADDLADDNRNTRTLIKEYALRRGSILVGRGDAQIEIAKSVETKGDYTYERRYPDGELYAHITGFYSVVFGRGGLEESANDVLVGAAAEEQLRNLGDFLAGRERQGDDVALTIDPAVQEAARDALGDKVGAVVAIEPATGALLAVYANPSYDPNQLSTFEQDAATQYWERTEDDRRNRALRELYPPGSTFKLITAAAALENGMSPDKTFPDPQNYTPPQTNLPIGNFGGGLCNGGASLTLTQAMAVSCNTVFARLGNQLGPDKLVRQAERFGVNQRWDSQVAFAPSAIPEELDAPATAQSAIGQRDVRMTPLQMAMVAAAIGNDGVLMRPHIIARVQDFNGRVIREVSPQPLQFADAEDGAAVSRATADDLQAMMQDVVTGGSGTAAAIPGVDVAGKTGTAQVAEGTNPTVWFVGFAPADNPKVAVAVVVPNGGDVGAEATGGAVAAPIARQVMEAALQ